MKNNSRVFPTKLYIRFIVHIVSFLFTRFFNIRKNMPVEVKKLKSPYLLLSNHIGFWDPFLAGFFLPNYTHFVSSDAAFRNPFFKFFLTRLGTIPKKKNMRDSQVIRNIVTVIKQGENVGLFPEAVRNWAGSSFYIDPSIVKLIKLLKVPVIVSVFKGMNLFNPRWSPKLRKTKVVVDYHLLLTAHDIKNLSEDEIYAKLASTLKHDEVEYQRNHMNIIRSEKRAEYISYTLYVCPECEAIDSFYCKGNDFHCTKCKYSIHIDKYGFFSNNEEGKLYFHNIRDWYSWEEKWLLKYISNLVKSNHKGIIFSDCDSKIYHSVNEKSEYLGEADVKLFIDKIELDFKDKSKNLELNFDDLKTINPQVSEILEIYYKNEAYRIVGKEKGVSALKWEVALNAIWRLKGQTSKLSSYIDSSFLKTVSNK